MKEADIFNLKKRYLVWLYKETKEALDRIERKFTQLEIDKFIREELRKNKNFFPKFFEEFDAYVNNKEKECRGLKSPEGDYLNPEHQFLALKLEATEKTIVKELGNIELEEIRKLYQQEMVERILKSREHS
ncbi:MAG: hypothetical protein N3A64_01085 [Desulfobacterota bacterium]|nr:hypothetical protein [Thermodesulfobacteriota bacterium]